MIHRWSKSLLTETSQAPLFEVFPYPKTSSLVKHGIPVYIDLEDERGKSVGTAHPDLSITAPLQYPCFALFLDIGTAILVRSTGRVSEIISKTRPEPPDGYSNKDRVMTSIDCRRQIEENPAAKTSLMKPLFDVERVGLATFTKESGPKDEDGFFVEPHAPERRAQKGKKEDVDVSKLSLEDIKHVSGTASWGPVTAEDPKVWLTVV